MIDPVTRSDAFDQKILAIPAGQVVPRWLAVMGFFGIAAIIAISGTFQYLSLRGVTESTNRAVKIEVPGLKQQISDRDRQIAEDRDVIGQATAAIVKLAAQVKDLGGDPGTITIRPTTTTTTAAAGH